MNADMTAPGGSCLDQSLYAADIAIAANFPFCVKNRYTTPKSVIGAHWGQHGGPLATGSTTVIRYTVPTQPTGTIAATELTFATASGLPASYFYGADGMVDLPFGPYAVLSYTTSPAPYSGEALLYAKDYGSVVSRAHVNGLYSNVGLGSGSGGRILYSGLSGMTAATTTTSENGLYASDVCSGSIVPTAPCAASLKLFGWTGYSGPVASDASGNVFMAASLMGGAHTDEIFGLSKMEALGSVAVAAASLVFADTSGTSSIAAIAPTNGQAGWILGKGFDFSGISPAYAQGYQVTSNHLQQSGALIAQALQPGTGMAAFSLFSDSDGNLWIAVDGMTDKVFLQLQPRP